MHITNRWTLALAAAALLAFAGIVAAQPVPAEKPAPALGKDLVVHEWGTFSTFSGSNGTSLWFTPYDNDLPEFVHGYLSRLSKKGPKGGRISLETPVVYFYSDRALKASVRVEFPRGTLTEWYPQAARTAQTLVWKEVEVAPGTKEKLPREEKPSRYYEARETDAAPLRAGTEAEKFLFYRGVGDEGMPLTVQALGGGRFTVAWSGPDLTGDLILVQVQAGKLKFQPFRFETREAGTQRGEVRIPDAEGTEEGLSAALVKQLVARGLFEKEAKAMVRTWRSAWFREEGTRVLYLLPAKLTEELLPLHVDPKPATLLRVLVGRHDVLTPEREKQIDALVTRVDRPRSKADQEAALQELAKLGRYTGAALSASEARQGITRP
jgi:hypothetical protein